MKLPLILLLVLGPLALCQADDSAGIKLRGRIVGTTGRKPIENATISVQGQSSHSDKTGAFEMIVPEYASWLRVSAKDFVAYRLSEVPTARDGIVNVGEIGLKPGQSVSGVVVDEDGEPISDFPVSMEPSRNSSMHSGTEENGDYFSDPLDENSHITVESRTKGDGTFVFAAQPQGSYTIEAGKRKVISRVTVNIGSEKVPLQRLVVKESKGQGGQHELTGRIVDEAGKPIAGAQVALIAQRLDLFASFPQAVSQADGTFKTRASGFITRVRVHSVSHPDFVFGAEKVESRNGNWNLSLVLRKGRTLRGRVVDTAGKAVMGAFVGLQAGRELPVKTDEKGAFVLPHVPLGEAIVLASDGPALATVTLPPNQNEVRIALPAPASQAKAAAPLDRLFEWSVAQLDWDSAWAALGEASVAKLLRTPESSGIIIQYMQFLARQAPEALIKYEAELRAALPADERAQSEPLQMLARASSSAPIWREQAHQWLAAQQKVQRPTQAESVTELLRIARVGARFGEKEGVMWLDFATHIAEQLEPGTVAEHWPEWAPKMMPISGDAARHFSQNWETPARMRFLALAMRTGIEYERVDDKATLYQQWKNLQQAAFEVMQLRNSETKGEGGARTRDILDEVRLLYATRVARDHPQTAFELATTLSAYGQVSVFLTGAKTAIRQKQFDVARRALQSILALRSDDPYDDSSLSQGAALAEQFDPAFAARLWNKAYENLVESTTREDRELFAFATYTRYARERARQSPGLGRIILEREWAKRADWNTKTTEEEQSVNTQTMGELAEAMTELNLYRAIEMAGQLPETDQRRSRTLSHIARLFLRPEENDKD